MGTIEAALRPKTRWCVCPHLHHRCIFAPGTAGVDVERTSQISAGRSLLGGVRAYGVATENPLPAPE